jgi:hypothetical protein
MSSMLDDVLEFADPRPRNPLGEFTGQEEGPDPNAMAKVYNAKRLGIEEGAGAATAGAVAGPLVKSLYGKLRKAKV